MPNLQPPVALSGNVGSMYPIAQHFPNLAPEGDIEELNAEWRLLPEFAQNPILRSAEDFIVFWHKVGKLENGMGEKMFPLLGKFVTALACLPHSSATVERVFSQLNLIKTKTRNRLHVHTCNELLSAKELVAGKTCYEWSPTPAMLARKPKRTVEEDVEDDEVFFE